MIGIRWTNDVDSELRDIRAAFAALPRHLARKHLQAAMRRTVKDGIPVLRAATPPFGVRRGRRRKGDPPRSTGALRRSVTTKAKYVSRSDAVYGIVGYRSGEQSRKAIWLEYGTSAGNRLEPRLMVEHFLDAYRGPSLARLRAEMASGLEAAARELASGKNPGRAG